MTKIQISDGSEKPVKKVKKIIVTDAPSVHSTVQKSTTLSRRYVKKPVVTAAKKAEEKKVVAVKKAKAARLAQLRAEKAAAKAARKAVKVAKKTSKNDRAIRSASAVITKMAKEPVKKAPKMEREFKKKNKAGRVFLALICSGATVAALVAFVHFSIPDLSVRVAAIQTGIDAAYPTFVPRNYTLSNVTSDKEGVVVMTFTGPEGASFTLSEEKSTWDSTALLNNYVKKNYPNDFATLREQGITIYVRGEKASWVSGGLLYKIDATGKYLTKEQIRNIATSL